jgi:putative transposase
MLGHTLHCLFLFNANQTKKEQGVTQYENNTLMAAIMEIINENGLEGLGDAITILINEAMKIERTSVLNAQPWERSEARTGYANGFKNKILATRMGKLQLQIPQVRGGISFYPSALERGIRSERALKIAIAEMYVQGTSTRNVTAVLEKLCGLEISSAQVSNASKLLDEELSRWRSRPLSATPYVQLDAMYEKVRRDGVVLSSSVLIATGIMENGTRTVLGVSVSLSEAEIHWRDFLLSLRKRGLYGIKLITSDDHTGLKKALTAVFPNVPWQRCQVHLQRNAVAYVPKVAMRKEVAADIRDIFNTPNRQEAERLLAMTVEKYKKTASNLATWMETNIPEGFTVFVAPKNHRKRLRSTNMVERLNREIRRRTRVATLFPNEASLMRLVSAILAETSDEWEAGRQYLSMDMESN